MALRERDAAILERAKSFANEACFTVALQHRRLLTAEPEDSVFVFRRHADLQFMLVALVRFRRAVELALNVPGLSPRVGTALAEFDRHVPALTKMRNVAEHIDDYVLGTGRSKDVAQSGLQVWTWSGGVFSWLDLSFDVNEAREATETLFAVLAESVRAAIADGTVSRSA